MENLLTPAQAGSILGVAALTLAKWRATRRYDLPYIKVGGKIAYRQSDLEKFLAARTVEGLSGPSPELKAHRWPAPPSTPKKPSNSQRRRKS